MLKKIAVALTAVTVLGLAAPASAQVIVRGGGWGHHHHFYRHYGYRPYDAYAYYPRHRFFHRRHAVIGPRW